MLNGVKVIRQRQHKLMLLCLLRNINTNMDYEYEVLTTNQLINH